MACRNYTEEFRRQAIDLYRSSPGATLRGIAADLGISRHTLQVWVHALDPELDPGPTSPSSELSSQPAARHGFAASSSPSLLVAGASCVAHPARSDYFGCWTNGSAICPGPRCIALGWYLETG